MKRVGFRALAGLAAVVGVSTAVSGPPSVPDTVSVHLRSFDRVWSTIRDKHWDPEMGGLDWNAVRDELRPRVERAADPAEVRGVLNEMISRLGLSHYGIIPAEVYEEMDLVDDDGSPYGATGIDVRVLGGRAVVTRVQPDSPAAAAGVRTGWIVVRVGGEDLAPVLETVAGEFAGGLYEDVVLASVVKTRLGGPVGSSVTAVFLDRAERPVLLELERVEQRGKRFQAGHLPPFHVWIEAERIEGDVGYVAFNAFVDPAHVMPAFGEAMETFRDAAGIVIDLRGNPGGFAPMAMGMAGWLIGDSNAFLGTIHTREVELKVVVVPRRDVFGGPVAVLVDGLSGSCSELFAGGLQDLGRARVFGSRTMGAALPSVVERLPNGDGFQYAFANYVSRGGEVLEGVGVVPDVEVEPSRESLLQGTDAALDAAVAWIREYLRKAPAKSREGGRP